MKRWLAAALLPLAGCAANENASDENRLDVRELATEYCESRGGESERRENRLGSARYCLLPDGRVENEWHLYQSERLAID